MTVKKFSELVLELVGRNNAEFNVDERVVMATVEVIIINLLKKILESGSNIPNSYYRSYVFDVKTDTTLNRKYIEFEPVPMPIGDNDGIAYVGATEDEYHINSNYVLLKPSQISQFAGLEAQHLGGRPAIRPEANRGYLYNEHPLTSKLRVLMIPQLSELKETDEMFGLDLQPLGSAEPDYVLRTTINYIKLKRGIPEDKLTDNQSN